MKKSKKEIEIEDEKTYRIHRKIKTFFRALLVLAVFLEIVEQRWTLMFATLLILFMTYLPEMFEKKYKIDIPTELELVIVIFIYASLFLGEIRAYYTRYWWWDIVLHTSSGVVLGFAGFLILYVLYYKKQIKANPFIIAVFVFCFALAIGAVWEIFEFGVDSILGYDMQKARNLEAVYGYCDTRLGVIDTMWDLIVDAIGALFAATLCYFYLKGKRPKFLERMIRNFIRNNPKLIS